MENELNNFIAEVNSCSKCKDICGAIGDYITDIALNYITPEIPVKVLFVAESPPCKKDNYFYNEKALNTKFRKRLFDLISYFFSVSFKFFLLSQRTY